MACLLNIYRHIFLQTFTQAEVRGPREQVPKQRHHGTSRGAREVRARELRHVTLQEDRAGGSGEFHRKHI